MGADPEEGCSLWIRAAHWGFHWNSGNSGGAWQKRAVGMHDANPQEGRVDPESSSLLSNTLYGETGVGVGLLCMNAIPYWATRSPANDHHSLISRAETKGVSLCLITSQSAPVGWVWVSWIIPYLQASFSQRQSWRRCSQASQPRGYSCGCRFGTE